MTPMHAIQQPVTYVQQHAVFPLKEDTGVGEDSETIREFHKVLQVDFFTPLSRQLEMKFSALERDWKESTQFLSSVSAISMHPSYQRIIGMGEKVLPLIFSSMKQEPDHWFWALHEITGENPVKYEHRGYINEMTNDWLEWGRQHHHTV
jgi:hypothetical protein